MGIRLSVMRVNTNKSPCSQVAWRKRGGSCCPINLIMFLLPEGPRRLPERATRAAQYVGIEYQCSAAPNSQLLFLLLFDLRFSCHSQCQMPLLTDYARDEISINGRTLGIFKTEAFLFRLARWNWTTAVHTLKRTALANSTSVTCIVLYMQYLTTFAWSFKCLAEVRGTSYTNLCIILHRERRQSSGALSDASIKTIFSPSTL